MKMNLKAGLLILLILVNGWALVFFVLPFTQEVMAVAALSMLIMAMIHERYVFLYAMSVVLSYGVFLTVYAFAISQRPDIEMLYVYSHLLFTSFILLYWLLLDHVKKMGYEASELRQQVQLLQKYTGESNVLTVKEFTEQATWVLKTSKRRQEEAWFVEIAIHSHNERIKENLKESLERVTVDTIRQEFDLVTSAEDTIYLLLKDIDEEGVHQLLNRYHEKVKQELNLLDSPYLVKKEQVTDLSELARAMGKAI